jgi:predicted RNA binding protein YcfA (HicA-like mRNA interferase family)
MSFPAHIWSQLKNLRKKDFIKALERDGWGRDPNCKGAILVFLKEGRSDRVTIHYHPQQTLGPKILKALIEDTGWNEDDLRRVGLIR